MTNISNRFLLVASIAGIGLPFLGSGSPVQLKKPNVLIILTDDMGCGDISCYNSDQVKTPNIDKLAKKRRTFY